MTQVAGYKEDGGLVESLMKRKEGLSLGDGDKIINEIKQFCMEVGDTVEELVRVYGSELEGLEEKG